MRKIYSLVLMTAMLFVGANAWATTYDVDVATYAQLIAAVEGPATGTGVYVAGDIVNITLTDNLNGTFSYTRTSTTGEDLTSAKNLISEIYRGQVITLNMNGHNITSNALYVFAIYYGKLYITGQGVISNTLERYTTDGGSSKTKFAEASVVLMCGINDPSCDAKRSYLNVGMGVSLMCAKGKAGVYVNQNDTETNSDHTGGSKTQKSTTKNLTWNTWSTNTKCAYGVYADIYGTVHGFRYGLQMSGNINDVNVPSESNHPSLPTYFVHSGSIVYAANTSSESCGIYLGGYCYVTVEGVVYGSTGVYAKSGVLVLNDATVYSNSTASYSGPQAGGSGANATGSGVVVDSNVKYPGEMNVTVSGDTKITGASGYAIEEVVTYTGAAPADTTQVNAINITGGTLETGEGGKGAITISENTQVANTDKSKETTVSVGAGTNVEGTVTVGTTGDMDDIIATGTHVTTVVDESGKTTVVISTGADPTPKTTLNDVLSAYDAWAAEPEATRGAAPTVKITGTGDLGSIVKDVTLTELEMNDLSNTQTITLGNPSSATPSEQKVTVTIGRVVLGSKAQIIVNPGSKLIVDGDQGIVAPSVNNIVLRSTATEQAIFLFKPTVNSNRNPNATVEFVSKSYRNDANDKQYQFFCPPMKGGVVESITATASDDNTTYQTVIDVWRLHSWDRIGIMNSETPLNMSKFNIPFGFYSILSNNPKTVKMTYTLKGSLVGNTAPELPLYEGWTAISNAFTGDMNIQKLWLYMKDRKDAGSNIDVNLYTYSMEGNTMVWTANNPIDWAMTEVDPMSSIMFKNNGAMEQIALSYGDLVWTPAISAAPARQMQFSNLTRVKMHVQGENGVLDRLTIAQSADFTAERDIYDAEQYINDDINFYVTDEDKMAIFATDNLVNTYLGFSCVNGGNFTLTFDNVEGEQLYLLDLNTNAIVAMVSGNTYQFTAADGEANDYRFKVVERQEMPTEVETVEENTIQNVGVYTLTGQYLGEMNVWNSLPAGLYIVNGEKKVK